MEYVLALVTQLHAVLLVIIVKLLMETVSVEQTVISTVTAAAMSTILHVKEAIINFIMHVHCYSVAALT